MASIFAVDVLEELSSDTSEELVTERKPKKVKSKREKDPPKKGKPAKKPEQGKLEKKKPEKEKPEKKPEKEKPVKKKRGKEKPEKKPEQKPEQEKQEKQEKEKPEKKPEKEKPEKKKLEQKQQEEEKRRSLHLLQLQSIKDDERRIARLMRRQRRNSFAIYFHKVLKNIHVDLSLSQRSVNILDSFVKDMFERIASEASFLARQTGSPTINSREIQTAVRLLLPGDLCKRAVAEGTMAMVRYISNK